MAVSDEDKQAVVAKIKQLTGENSVPCPVCYFDEWEIDGYFRLVRYQSREGDIPVDADPVPLIMVACAKCGYSRFHRATTIKK